MQEETFISLEACMTDVSMWVLGLCTWRNNGRLKQFYAEMFWLRVFCHGVQDICDLLLSFAKKFMAANCFTWKSRECLCVRVYVLWKSCVWKSTSSAMHFEIFSLRIWLGYLLRRCAPVALSTQICRARETASKKLRQHARSRSVGLVARGFCHESVWSFLGWRSESNMQAGPWWIFVDEDTSSYGWNNTEIECCSWECGTLVLWTTLLRETACGEVTNGQPQPK